MHTTEIGANNVPAFLVKLWKLVEDEKCNDLISWSTNGQSFIIHNQTQFAKELLPLYFKHNNMASFVRQLNMYGFRKVASIDQGSLRSEREGIEFFHNFFVRGQESLLEFIKRKVPTGRNGGEDGQIRSEVMKELLSDVGSMQGRQEHVDQLLSDMKKENEALWREVAMLRQKHMKQQQIVEKLIHFLVTMVQANHNITVKRKMPLMLHDSPSSSAKIPRLGKSHFGGPGDGHISSADYQVSSPASQVSEGPVIRDVTDLLDDGELSQTAIGSQRAPLSPALGAPGTSSTSSGPMDLDSGPVVVSPLNPAEPVDSLPLLDPLEQNDSFYILPDDLHQEVVVESVPSPGKAVLDTKLLESKLLDSNKTDGSLDSAIRMAEGGASDLLLDGNMPLDVIPLGSAADLENTCALSEDTSLPLETVAPGSSGCGHSSTADGVSNLPDEKGSGMQVALKDNSSASSASFAEHVETIDTELDWLQDQLLSGGLNLDASTLMGLFAPEDPLTSCLGDLATESRAPDTIGNEVVHYTTPSLVDLGLDTSFYQTNDLLSDDEFPANSTTTGCSEPTSDAAGNAVPNSKDLPSVESVPLPATPSMSFSPDGLPKVAVKKGSSSKKRRKK